jgi:hypothetical protein
MNRLNLLGFGSGEVSKAPEEMAAFEQVELVRAILQVKY